MIGGGDMQFGSGLNNPNFGGRYYRGYHQNYEELLKRILGSQSPDMESARGYLRAGAGAVGSGVPQETRDYFGRATSPYTPRAVDPETAIKSGMAPIESRRQEQFSAVMQKLGRLGGMGGTPQALGLGRVAQQSAQDIAALTNQYLYDASKFNVGTELEAERMRREAEMRAGQALLDAARDEYERQLRAAALSGEWDMRRGERLSGLTATLAGLAQSGQESDIEKTWRSAEARKSWVRDMGFDPDDPSFNPWDPWGHWTRRQVPPPWRGMEW